MRLALCLLLAAILIVPAAIARGQTAATPPAGAIGPGSAAAPPQVDSYRICPGDLLSISVDGDQLLTRECQVNGAGTVSYPLLGDVWAAGETCTSLASQLHTSLSKYLKSPQVMVTVRQYGQVGMSVFVMGEVAKPGVYPMASGAGVMQPIAAAGGLTDLASGEITILKAGTGESHTYLLDELNRAGNPRQPLLQPGDVILVDRKNETRYAVLGEVPTPGMFDMPGKGELRLLDAMVKSGLLQQNATSRPGSPPSPNIVDDPTRTADLEHSFLTRRETKIPVNLAALVEGDTAQNLVLQPGDVLTVPRRPGVRVYALGEVRSPGRIYLSDQATVMDLLNAAGGTTSAASLGSGAILRTVDGKPTSLPVDLGLLLSKGDAKQNIPLQQGDVLYVPAKGDKNDTIWRMLLLVPHIGF
jgi:polysaccharide export outer membrane protein